MVLRGLAEQPNAAGTAIALLNRAGAGASCVWIDLAAWAAAEDRLGPKLDEAVARHAQSGTYTVLHGETAAWAERYADEPAVLFSLPDTGPASAGLEAALAAMRAVHPRAVAMIPAHAPAAQPGLPGTVLRWDVLADGQPSVMTTLGHLHHQPVIVAGWHPVRGSMLGNERMLQACLRGGIGWIAHDTAPWMQRRRGVEDWSRAAHSVLRALVISANLAVPHAA